MQDSFLKPYSLYIPLFLIIFILSQNVFPVTAQSSTQNFNEFFQFKDLNTPATVLVNQNFTLTGTLIANLPVRSADEVYLSITGSDNAWIYGEKIFRLSKFGDNDERPFSYTIRAINPGPIDINLKVTGLRNQFIMAESESSLRVQAVETLDGTSTRPILSFTEITYPSNVNVNENFPLSFSIKNTGAIVAKNVIVTAELPPGIFHSGDSTFNLKDIGPDDSKDIQFILKSNQKGSYNIKLKVFSSNSPIPISLPLSISINDEKVKLAATNLRTNPLQIYPGSTGNEIKIGLTNYGEDSLEAISAKLELIDGIFPSWSGSDQTLIGFLPSIREFPSFTSQFATFYVDIDKSFKPGNYDFNLLLDSISGGKQQLSVPILILPKANFQIDSISYSGIGSFGTETFDSISPGKTTVMRTKLTNTGTAPAEFLIVQLQASNDFEGLRSDIKSSGNIDNLGMIFPGQTLHATFFLNVDDTVEPGLYPATLSINWQQNKLSKEFSQSVPLNINVTETPIIDQIPYLQIFLLAITIIFLILYLRSRLQKNILTDDTNSKPKSSAV